MKIALEIIGKAEFGHALARGCAVVAFLTNWHTARALDWHSDRLPDCQTDGVAEWVTQWVTQHWSGCCCDNEPATYWNSARRPKVCKCLSGPKKVKSGMEEWRKVENGKCPTSVIYGWLLEFQSAAQRTVGKQGKPQIINTHTHTHIHISACACVCGANKAWQINFGGCQLSKNVEEKKERKQLHWLRICRL